MNALQKLSLEIYHARRARDEAVTPEAFRLANYRVAGAFEAWKAIALKGAQS